MLYKLINSLQWTNFNSSQVSSFTCVVDSLACMCTFNNGLSYNFDKITMCLYCQYIFHFHDLSSINDKLCDLTNCCLALKQRVLCGLASRTLALLGSAIVYTWRRLAIHSIYYGAVKCIWYHNPLLDRTVDVWCN